METDEQVVANFELHVRRHIAALQALGHPANVFTAMVADYGAVGATRRLILDPAPSYGLWRLAETGNLSLSVELATLLPAYRPLFDDAVRDAAWRKLELLGVKVPDEIADADRALVRD
ncbi:hypothetical protein [Actinokineospora pegani]|uniref:hypothetical protein n=1 Tax=Actinokineospora pegani TaxID=2654637 RepID=UPI0012E9FBD5|nr:hypothetical protein [Actinokineospora pegani]